MGRAAGKGDEPRPMVVTKDERDRRWDIAFPKEKNDGTK